MSLQMMYRAVSGESVSSQPMFSGDPYWVFDFEFIGMAKAGIRIRNDGIIEEYDSNGIQSLSGRWDGGGSFNIADYDFRFNKFSGDLDGPFTDGIWYPGSGAQIDFYVETSGVQNATGSLLMRPAGGGVTIDTADVTLDAETV